MWFSREELHKTNQLKRAWKKFIFRIRSERVKLETIKENRNFCSRQSFTVEGRTGGGEEV